MAGLQRRGVALLAAERILVLPLARDLELLRDVAALDRHVAPVGRIDQAVAHHAVDEHRVPQPVAEAGLIEQVGRLAHVLHPTGDQHLRIAVSDEEGRQVHGFERGGAYLVDGERRNARRQPGFDGGLPGGNLAHAGSDDGAHDDLVDLGALDLRPVDHLLDHDRTQVGCR